MLKFLNSSLGRKYTMALTGLFLVVFLLEHLYTNLLLLKADGGVAFNEASHSMVHNLIIRIIEVVLFAAIILHVYQAVTLTRQNAKARPVGYATNNLGNSSSWMSRNMGLTGSLILFFIIVHLWQFFVPYRITDTVGHEGQETIAYHVKEAFENPLYVILYLVSLLVLGFHLNHGFQSAFQTLGLNGKEHSKLLKNMATGVALLFTVGFGLIPVLFLIKFVGETITQ